MYPYSQAVEEPGVKIFRFHSDLTFANKEHFEAKLAKLFLQNVSRVPIHTLVIDCTAIHTVDSSAAEALMALVEGYQVTKGSMQVGRNSTMLL